MPICTRCSAPVPSLWTEYSTPTNIRLTVCGRCKRFADPWVEQPPLVHGLDLLLLKPGVYRHHMWNRGIPPLRARSGSAGDGALTDHPPFKRNEILTDLLLRLSAVTVAVDAYLLWTEAPFDSRPAAWMLLLTCAFELAVFQAGVTLACALVFAARRQWDAFRGIHPRQIYSPFEHDFRFALVPLTVVLSSLPKTLLLFLLSIFPEGQAPLTTDSATFLLFPVFPPLQSLLETHCPGLEGPALGQLVRELDRKWILRHLLQGLSNGFALKVLLAPLGLGAGASTACVLAGYVARAAILPVLGREVGHVP